MHTTLEDLCMLINYVTCKLRNTKKGMGMTLNLIHYHTWSDVFTTILCTFSRTLEMWNDTTQLMMITFPRYVLHMTSIVINLVGTLIDHFLSVCVRWQSSGVRFWPMKRRSGWFETLLVTWKVQQTSFSREQSEISPRLIRSMVEWSLNCFNSTKPEWVLRTAAVLSRSSVASRSCIRNSWKLVDLRQAL